MNSVGKIAEIYKVNIVLPSNKNNYYLYYNYDNLIDYDNYNYNYYLQEIYNIFDISLVCHNNSFYNYELSICLDSIPQGYYCDDLGMKTLNKCSPNCKTCNKGPTLDNNNCLTCPDTNTTYFDSGNCTSECSNDYFTDENFIKKCKCINNKCLLCSEESLKLNLCESCNINSGFYPMKNYSENIGDYINCYNKNITISGYFFNNNTNMFEPCHPNCQKCYRLEDENNNKCIECISGYELIKDKNNTENCYPKCNYYYFDINNRYICIDNDTCPNNYKLINSTNKCIDDCSKDNIYNFKCEYNNICYEKCPKDSKINEEEELSESTNLYEKEELSESTNLYEEEELSENIKLYEEEEL